MVQFPITRSAAPKQPPPDETLRFGQVFTDHMFVMDYHSDRGWHGGFKWSSQHYDEVLR